MMKVLGVPMNTTVRRSEQIKGEIIIKISFLQPGQIEPSAII